MTSNILLLDCSKLQSTYDVMIAVWQYESKTQLNVTQDNLTAEIFSMYKKHTDIDADGLRDYLKEEYEFTIISPASLPYFKAFFQEIKNYHNHALTFKDTYHYICIKSDTLFLELE